MIPGFKELRSVGKGKGEKESVVFANCPARYTTTKVVCKSLHSGTSLGSAHRPIINRFREFFLATVLPYSYLCNILPVLV